MQCDSIPRFLLQIKRAPKPQSVCLAGTFQADAADSTLYWLTSQGQAVGFRCAPDFLSSVAWQQGDWLQVHFTFQPQNWVEDDPRGPIHTGGFDGWTLLGKAQNTTTASFPAETAALWADFLGHIRTYLKSIGLLEVETPHLVLNPGMEPHINAFATEWVFGSQRQRLHLPTSPELHLKQLLAAGYTDIFQMAMAFRNDELSPTHEPEFHMLEWYRAFADLQLIEADLTGLLQHFVPDLEVITTSMAQLFRDSLRFDLRPDTTANELRALCQQSGVENSPSDSWDDLFHRLFLEKVEPILTAAGPKTAFIVKDFPPSQAALAKLTPDGFADRFELYWKGLEIANAYNELTDADEQLRRHQADQATRRELQRPDHPMDWNFIRALRRGVPPSGGIALGLDRLFMAVYDFSSIQQTRAFPMRHEVAGVNA